MRAIGYIWVSTEKQATEGISLDAQKIRLQAHCIAMDIELIDSVIDDGYSAKSIERPGLQRALSALTGRQADALVVVKLDRLTRNLRDFAYLIDSYFGEGRPWSLLSVSDAIDTRSASGKLNLNVVMSVSQWERETISERTKEALVELRRQGVPLGQPPYGWRHSQKVDESGRRILASDPDEQHGIRRICELYDADMYINDICRILEGEGIPTRRNRWHRQTVYQVLSRAGYEDLEGRERKSAPSRREKALALGPVIRDKGVCAWRATQLRAQGLSMRQIGAELLAEHYLPPRSDLWHAGSVFDLLRMVPTPPSRTGEPI